MAVAHDPAIARTIIDVGREMGADQDRILAALAAALVESNMANVSHGDRDSLGVFQQRPSQGWGTPQQVQDPEYAARKFYEAAAKVSDYDTVGGLAQAVQRSAFPERYDERLADARELLRSYANPSQTPMQAAGGSVTPLPEGAGFSGMGGGEGFSKDLLATVIQTVTDAANRVGVKLLDADFGRLFNGGRQGDPQPQWLDLLPEVAEEVPEGVEQPPAPQVQLRYADGTEETAPEFDDRGEDSAGTETTTATGTLAWGGHSNGRIPRNQLVAVRGVHHSGEGVHYMAPSAAADFQRMVADAAKEGVKITLTDSYRDYETQVRLRDEKGDQVATATPGTSIHGWGKAIDIATGREWVHENGARYGWIWPEWAQREGTKSYEPWHAEHRGGPAGRRGGV